MINRQLAVFNSSEAPIRFTADESVGFVRAGLLPNIGFKFDRWLDSVLMQRALSA